MRHDGVCPECERRPYRGSHRGENTYRCRTPSCRLYATPLARTKRQLRYVAHELG